MNNARRSGRKAGSASCAAVAVMLLVSAAVQAQVNTWVTKAPILRPNSVRAAGTVDGKIYVIGYGNDICMVTPPYCNSGVQVYNPRMDTWSAMPGRPTSFYYPVGGQAVGVLAGLVYSVGGIDGAGRGLGQAEAYDPKTDTWTPVAPMNVGRAALAVAVVDGILYALGGSAGRNRRPPVLSAVETYDPKRNEWCCRPVLPMPTGRWYLAAASLDGIIYAMGGYVTGGTSSGAVGGLVEAYDTRTNTWTSKAPMPTARAGLVAVEVDGLIYAIGGNKENYEFTDVVEVYDPKEDKWDSTVPPLLHPRFRSVGAVVNGTIYIIGGMTQIPGTGTCCSFVTDATEAYVAFVPVAMDLKPDDASNTINLNSRATIQVAILSTAEFDALTVGPASLTLTPSGGQGGARVVTNARGTPLTVLRDVDRDGRLDLVVHFRVDALGLSPSDTEAVLRGATFSGQRIRGADSILVFDEPWRPQGQNDARGRQRPVTGGKEARKQ